MVEHFNQASFEAAIAGDKPVLVDFWATWCGPCRMIAPVIEQVAAQYDGRAIVGKAAGESFTFNAPAGSFTMKVVSVSREG